VEKRDRGRQDVGVGVGVGDRRSVVGACGALVCVSSNVHRCRCRCHTHLPPPLFHPCYSSLILPLLLTQTVFCCLTSSYSAAATGVDYDHIHLLLIISHACVSPSPIFRSLTQPPKSLNSCLLSTASPFGHSRFSRTYCLLDHLPVSRDAIPLTETLYPRMRRNLKTRSHTTI